MKSDREEVGKARTDPSMHTSAPSSCSSITAPKTVHHRAQDPQLWSQHVHHEATMPPSESGLWLSYQKRGSLNVDSASPYPDH